MKESKVDGWHQTLFMEIFRLWSSLVKNTHSRWQVFAAIPSHTTHPSSEQHSCVFWRIFCIQPIVLANDELPSRRQPKKLYTTQFYALMNPWICFGPIISLLLLVCAPHAVRATLTPGEEGALREILKNYPDLYTVPSWASLDEFNNYYGSSWNDSFSTLCQNDGYDFYGVYCMNGHVGGLFVYATVFSPYRLHPIFQYPN